LDRKWKIRTPTPKPSGGCKAETRGSCEKLISYSNKLLCGNRFLSFFYASLRVKASAVCRCQEPSCRISNCQKNDCQCGNHLSPNTNFMSPDVA
jgi:hypothetical protein